MILNPGDIVTTHMNLQHWLIYECVKFDHDVVQYQFFVLEKGTWECYTSPFGGEMPEAIFKLAA